LVEADVRAIVEVRVTGKGMTSMTFRAALSAVLICFSGAAFSQEAQSAAASSLDNSDTESAAIEECFNVPGLTDMSVMSDQHIYIRTRGGNHYLVTTEQCRNLERSYHRGTARFVPYGRTVCQNDGSYVLYDSGGRESACPILSIERVDDRAEARSIAEVGRPLVETEEVTVPAN
jgi:hypothetical protein